MVDLPLLSLTLACSCLPAQLPVLIAQVGSGSAAELPYWYLVGHLLPACRCDIRSLKETKRLLRNAGGWRATRVTVNTILLGPIK